MSIWVVHESWASFLSGGSHGQAAGSATTVEEAFEGCTRAVHESGRSGARRCTIGARHYTVVHEIAEWCSRTSGARWCARLRSGARDWGVVHDGIRVEVPTVRQQEVPWQLRKLVSGAWEWYEWCTSWLLGISGARDGARVGCMRLGHEGRGACDGCIWVQLVHKLGARDWWCALG